MNYVNAFQKIALSLGVLFFGIGVFIYSINPAQADNPTVTNSTGKYMMHQNSFVFKDFNYQILVWDTETGKSKLYSFTNSGWSNDIAQLPSSPLY
jgi:hypothetical protein